MGRLLRAAGSGETEEVAALLRAGHHPDTKDSYGNTSLLLASERGHTQVLQLLLAAGADINHRNTAVGWSALHCAGYTGQVEAVRLLVEGGANPGLRDRTGDTAECWAREWGHSTCAEILRQAALSQSEERSPVVGTQATQLSQMQRLEHSHTLDILQEMRNFSLVHHSKSKDDKTGDTTPRPAGADTADGSPLGFGPAEEKAVLVARLAKLLQEVITVQW